MPASSPNTAMLPQLVTSAMPPVPENGSGSLKRKAHDVLGRSADSLERRAMVPNPIQAAAVVVTPRAVATFGTSSEMAISLDAGDDEKHRRMPTAPIASVTTSAVHSAENPPKCAPPLPPVTLAPAVGTVVQAPQPWPTNGVGPSVQQQNSCTNTVATSTLSTTTRQPTGVTNGALASMGAAPTPAAGANGGSATLGASSPASLSAPTHVVPASTNVAANVTAPAPSAGIGSRQAGVSKTATYNGNIYGGPFDRNTISPPKPKRRGRPLGSKNKKVMDDDDEYVANKYAQRSANFTSNVSTRPRRNPGARQRWADEMANPGDQWQRKVSLPPNPVDANFDEAPTFYPTVEEFQDPLSYVESIRPAAEDFGIAKIVPPPGWKPPKTPMNEHINKLLPTKKQALHSLMQSDEVYDDGEDFTVKEYKSMADEFAAKWTMRDSPPELMRRNPRRIKAETPGYAFTPIPFPANVKAESVPVAAKVEEAPAQAQATSASLYPIRPAGAQTNGALTNRNTTTTFHGSATKTEPVPAYSNTQCTPNAAKAMAAAATAAAAGASAGVERGCSQPPVPGGSSAKTEEETIHSLPNLLPEVTDFPEERLRELEREYWNVVDGGAEEAEVEYANDLDISEFWSGFPLPPENFMEGAAFDRTKPCNFDDPEYYRTCGWNLNNLPFWPGSVLRFFRTHVNGLTAPWLYLGMQFATFAWHNEDNYLYSLNYHHSGAPKQWYGVPGKHALGFEACLARMLGETMDTVSEHLYRITKMLSPVYLQREKVPVCRLRQEAGQFVVTFPKAYHGGFSYGFNCGEAVNFAVPDWIAYSRESTEAYRQASRKAALSHDKMVATLTMYLPDHDVKGCELVVAELKRIQNEELNGRRSLELEGAQDPSKSGLQLPRFRLGLIDQDTEEYDERRMCKTCKHTLFMTGVACRCNDLDVSCIRCVKDACDCPMTEKYLLSWWTEADLSRFVATAEAYLRRLRAGRADEAAVKSFNDNIDPF